MHRKILDIIVKNAKRYYEKNSAVIVRADIASHRHYYIIEFSDMPDERYIYWWWGLLEAWDGCRNFARHALISRPIKCATRAKILQEFKVMSYAYGVIWGHYCLEKSRISLPRHAAVIIIISHASKIKPTSRSLVAPWGKPARVDEAFISLLMQNMLAMTMMAQLMLDAEKECLYTKLPSNGTGPRRRHIARSIAPFTWYRVSFQSFGHF